LSEEDFEELVEEVRRFMLLKLRDHAAVAAEDGNQLLADVLREVARRAEAE